MNKSWAIIVLLIALLFAVNSSSVQGQASAAPNVAGAVIHFVCCSYTPAEVVIQPGQSVEWDGDFSMHPLVSDDGLWITPTVGSQFIFTFTMTGTFLFHCANHGGPGGVGMSGRVIVKEFENKLFLPLVVRM